jgi:hypothetical protein
MGLAACRKDRIASSRKYGRLAHLGLHAAEEAAMGASGQAAAGVTVPDTKLARDAATGLVHHHSRRVWTATARHADTLPSQIGDGVRVRR